MQVDALVVNGPGSGFVMETLTLNEPRRDEVMVRIEAVGVCHTDIGVAAGYLPNHPYPCVLGHEGVGTVEWVGDSVSHVRVGDRVLLTGPRCGACAMCRRGEPAYCADADRLVFRCCRVDGSTGWARPDGQRVASHFFGQSSFATVVIANAAATVPIVSVVPFHLAAPIGCGIVTGWGTVVNHLKVQPGDTVLTVGTGAVGMTALITAHHAGAKVWAVDPISKKRDLAKSLGAEGTFAAIDVEEIRDVTGGGADHVVCSVGDLDTISASIAVAGRRGTIALIGGAPPGSRVAIDANDVLFEGKRIHGVRMGDQVAARDLPRIVALWEDGHLPLEQLVQTWPMRDIADALAAVSGGDCIKAVLLPGS
jgi:aryl-alcohol dehydrogenase